MIKDNNYELFRVNFRISKKLKNYFEEKSLETGVSQSALMALALEEYVFQKECFGNRDKSGYELNNK